LAKDPALATKSIKIGSLLSTGLFRGNFADPEDESGVA
jgi:hypothetical protein